MGIRRWVRRALLGVGLVLAVGVVGFLLWAGTPRPLEEDRFEAVLDDPAFEVGEVDGHLFLQAAGASPDLGVVFYPGARVPAGAYLATWAEVVTRTDVVVFIPAMRLNLAVLSPNRAADIIAAHPEIATWAVGGHSLGGSMAAAFAGENPEIAGLVLWASYPADGEVLAGRSDLQGVSVVGGRDGLATPSDVAERASFLPPGVPVEVIDGMNHAQFGAYGEQSGDRSPTLSPEQAASLLGEATAAALTRVADTARQDR